MLFICECVGICEIFEDKLKREHRGQANISYGVKDLLNWIDEIGDMGALVFVFHATRPPAADVNLTPHHA